VCSPSKWTLFSFNSNAPSSEFFHLFVSLAILAPEGERLVRYCSRDEPSLSPASSLGSSSANAVFLFHRYTPRKWPCSSCLRSSCRFSASYSSLNVCRRQLPKAIFLYTFLPKLSEPFSFLGFVAAFPAVTRHLLCFPPKFFLQRIRFAPFPPFVC